MESAIAVVLAYLIGSIDFAILVARAQGVDIRVEGSGNPGSANVMRTLGWKAAAPVMLGDLAKGVVGAALGTIIGGSTTAGLAAGLAAVIGHCYPVWHGFRGGKGVATTLGVAWWIAPLVGLVLTGVWLGLLAVTRTSSLGSLVAVLLLAPALAVAGVDAAGVALAAAITVLVVARHHDNIRRLLGGAERTV